MMEYGKYVDKIEELSCAAGFGRTYRDRWAWHAEHDDGLTPQEAWDTEMLSRSTRGTTMTDKAETVQKLKNARATALGCIDECLRDGMSETIIEAYFVVVLRIGNSLELLELLEEE